MLRLGDFTVVQRAFALLVVTLVIRQQDRGIAGRLVDFLQ